MRWKLKTLLFVVALACMVLARFSYLKTRYANLQRAGAAVYYDWQNPTLGPVTLTASGFGDQVYITDQHYVSCTQKQRSWMGKLGSAFVGDSAVAVSIPVDSLNSDLIADLKSISTLEDIMLTETREIADSFELPDVGATKRTEETNRETRSKMVKQLDGLNLHWQTTYSESH